VRTLVDSVNARGAPDNVTVMIAVVRGEDDDPTEIQPIVQLPPATGSGPNLRYLAAAAAGVALVLAALLLVLVLQQSGVLDDSRNLAAPVDAGPDVAAPPEAGRGAADPENAP